MLIGQHEWFTEIQIFWSKQNQSKLSKCATHQQTPSSNHLDFTRTSWIDCWCITIVSFTFASISKILVPVNSRTRCSEPGRHVSKPLYLNFLSHWWTEESEQNLPISVSLQKYDFHWRRTIKPKHRESNKKVKLACWAKTALFKITPHRITLHRDHMELANW